MVFFASLIFLLYFFFQADDGIRAPLVTGVQTCALPISHGVSAGAREAVAGLAAVLVAALAVVIGFHREPLAVTYEPDDPIYPGGQKRDRDAIVRFMNTDVMPWARATLGPLKGGPDRVTCATCHGRDAESRDWRMPAVAALPQPDVRE